MNSETLLYEYNFTSTNNKNYFIIFFYFIYYIKTKVQTKVETKVHKNLAIYCKKGYFGLFSHVFTKLFNIKNIQRASLTSKLNLNQMKEYKEVNYCDWIKWFSCIYYFLYFFQIINLTRFIICTLLNILPNNYNFFFHNPLYQRISVFSTGYVTNFSNAWSDNSFQPAIKN